MSDITSLAIQKVTKPNIEDVMPYYLDGDALKNALDFVAHLRANKMKPSWTLHNAWKAVNKGKVLYYIRFPVYKSTFFRPYNQNWERSWCVTPYLINIAQYENMIADDKLKKIIVDNMYGCEPHSCGDKCSTKNQEIKITICGTELIRYCHHVMLGNRSLWILNPNENEIDSIKKMLDFERQVRIENAKRK